MIVDDIRRLSPAAAAWVDGLPEAGPDTPLPDEPALPEALLDLAVPHADINEIVAAHRAFGPALAPLVRRCAWAVLDEAHVPDAGSHDSGLMSLPPEAGAPGRLLHIFVALAVAPHTRRHHAEAGIDPEITRRSLADVGRHVARHHRRHGTAGVLAPWWIANILRGRLFQLGRLQFQPARLGGRTGAGIAAAGGTAGPGDPSLELHIPDFLGPLTPAAVDRSLELARTFFAGGGHRVACCHSWLLDPQLADRLPPGSNIVAFQRRFRPAYEVTAPADLEPLSFVFDDPSLPLAELPRDSTLRRVLVEHLLAGGHWRDGNGWLPWPG
jgi:hypothetical protein